MDYNKMRAVFTALILLVSWGPDLKKAIYDVLTVW